MLPFQGDAAESQSYISSSYIELHSVSDRLSLKRLTAQRSRTDRILHDNYILWRDRQLLQKLVRNEALYNAVRNLLLSESNSSLVRKTVATADPFEAGNSMIDLVDKGAVLGPRKHSDCCSCCSSKCRLREQIKKQRRRKRLHGDGFILCNSITGSSRSLANKFLCKAKHVKSEPCTCTPKLSIVILRGSKSHLQCNLNSSNDERRRKNTEKRCTEFMQPYVYNCSISQRVPHDFIKPQPRYFKRNMIIRNVDEVSENNYIVSKYNSIFNSLDIAPADRCTILNRTPNFHRNLFNKRLYLCEPNSGISLKDTECRFDEERYKLKISKISTRIHNNIMDVCSKGRLQEDKNSKNNSVHSEVHRSRPLYVPDYERDMTTCNLSAATSISQNMLHGNTLEENDKDGVVKTSVSPVEEKLALKTTSVQTLARCSCFIDLPPQLECKISKTCQCNSSLGKAKPTKIFKRLPCKYKNNVDILSKIQPDSNICRIELSNQYNQPGKTLKNLDLKNGNPNSLFNDKVEKKKMKSLRHILMTALHCKCRNAKRMSPATNSHKAYRNIPTQQEPQKMCITTKRSEQAQMKCVSRKVCFKSNVEMSRSKEMLNELNIPLTENSLPQNNSNNNQIPVQNVPVQSHIIPPSLINTEQITIHNTKEVSSQFNFVEPVSESKNTLKITSFKAADSCLLSKTNNKQKLLVKEIIEPFDENNVVILIKIGQIEKSKDAVEPKPGLCTLKLQKHARNCKKYIVQEISKQPDVNQLPIKSKNDVIKEVHIETVCRKKETTSVSCGVLKKFGSVKALQTKTIVREKQTEAKFSKQTRTSQSKVKMCNKFVGVNLKLKRCFCNLKFLNESNSKKYNFKRNPFKGAVHPINLYYMNRNQHKLAPICKNIDKITSLPHLPSYSNSNSYNAFSYINRNNIENERLSSPVSTSSLQVKSGNTPAFFHQHEFMDLIRNLNQPIKPTTNISLQKCLRLKSQLSFDIHYLHAHYNFHSKNTSNCFNSCHNCMKYSELNATFIDQRIKIMERNNSPPCLFGIGPYLKRCYCTMNIQISGRRNKLKPYECEPGVCVPYECDPVECQKLIMKRLKRNANVGSGTSIKRKSNSTSTLKSETKSKVLQSGARHNDRQVIERQPRRNNDTMLDNKRVVRLGSNFNFDIVFSKEVIGPNERQYSSQAPRKSQYSSIDPQRRHYKTKGTTGRSSKSYDTESQSDMRKFRHRGSNARMKRCYCTLKLQKTGRGRKSKINPDQILKNRSISALQNKHYDSLSRETSQNTKIKHKQKLLPYECEPGICVPGECNPHECLELINRRLKKNKGTNSTKSGISSGTNMSNTQRRRKNRQSQQGYKQRPAEYVKEDTSAKPSRQAVRIGSSFSFNIEFFKEDGSRVSGEGQHQRVRYDERTPIRDHRYKHSKRNTYSQGSRSIRHTNSQMSVPKRTNSTTTSFLKRCFCTLKLLSAKKQKKSQLKKEKILKKPKRERSIKPATHVTQTSKPHTVSVLEPYECEPGVCVPGSCDPHECLKRIQRRNNSTMPNRKKVRSKSVASSFDTSKSMKLGTPRREQDSSVTNTHIIRNDKRLISHGDIQQYSPQRQAVRIGSTFSFNIEFYKDISPGTRKMQTAGELEKYQLNNYGIQTKDGQTAYGSRLYNQGSQADIRYQQHRGSGSGPLLKRCFCTLELQNANKKGRVYANRQTDSRGIRNIPTLHDRSVMARNQRRRQLLPYECEPNVCVPGSCDPYECQKRIKKRLLNHARGTSTYGRPSRSVSSTTTMRHRESQFSGEPLRRRRIEEITEGMSSGPPRQGVRISSSFSFNIEFYKEGTPGGFNISTARTDQSPENFRKPNSEKSRQTSQVRINTREANSQSTLAKQRAKAVGGTPFLKRCFCTLQLRKGTQNKKTSPKKHSIKNINEYKNVGIGIRQTGKPNVVAMERGIGTKRFRQIEPYECEPGVCVPGECDPYECLKRIKARKVRSCCTQNQKCCMPASTCCPPVAKAQKDQTRQTPVKRYRSDSLLNNDKPANRIETPSRQAVRMGSTFSFNVEFFKESNGHRTLPTQAYQQYPRRRRNMSTYGDNHRRRRASVQSQGTTLASRASATGRILKRCMCTLKLQKLGHQKSNPKRKERQTPKNISTATPIGNRHQIVAIVARDVGTKPKMRMCACLDDVTHQSKSVNTRIVKTKKIKNHITIPPPSIASKHRSQVSDTIENVNRQAICFGSKISFNFDFYNNRPLPETQGVIQNSKSREETMQLSENKKSKGNFIGPVKRCLCTLTLQRALVHYTYKNEIKNLIENKMLHRSIKQHVPNSNDERYFTFESMDHVKNTNIDSSDLLYFNKNFCTSSKILEHNDKLPYVRFKYNKKSQGHSGNNNPTHQLKTLHPENYETGKNTKLIYFAKDKSNLSHTYDNHKQRTLLFSSLDKGKVNDKNVSKNMLNSAGAEHSSNARCNKKETNVFTLKNLIWNCFNLSKSYNTQNESHSPKTATCCRKHPIKPTVSLLNINSKLYRPQNLETDDKHGRDKTLTHLEENNKTFGIPSKIENKVTYSSSKYGNVILKGHDKVSINQSERSRQNVNLASTSKKYSISINFAKANNVTNNAKKNMETHNLRNGKNQKQPFFKRLISRCFQVFSKPQKAVAVNYKNNHDENVNSQRPNVDSLKASKSDRRSKVIDVHVPKKKSNFITTEKSAMHCERKVFIKSPNRNVLEIKLTPKQNKKYKVSVSGVVENSDHKQRATSENFQATSCDNLKSSYENTKRLENEPYVRLCNCHAAYNLNKSTSKTHTQSPNLPLEFAESRNVQKKNDQALFGHQKYDVFYSIHSKKTPPLKMIKTCQCIGICKCPKINEKTKSCGTVGTCTCCICKKKIKPLPKPVKNLCTCGNPFCNKEFKKVNMDKAKASSVPPPIVRPCVCGSRICKKETRKLQHSSKKITKEKAVCSCPKHSAGKSCECSVYLGKSKKKRAEERMQARKEEELNKKKAKLYAKKQKQKLRLHKLRQKKRKIEKKKREKRDKADYKKRLQRYAEEDALRATQRKAYDKQMLKNLEKYKNSGNASLILESVLDIAKLGVVSATDILRFAAKTAEAPKQSLIALGRNIAEPDRAFTKLQHLADHSPGIATLKRVRWRLSHTTMFKTGKLLLESHPVTDFLLHPTDVKGRKARRRVRRKRPRLDLQCSPYMLSLRKIPCVNVYLLCPWFYPHCMSLVQFWKNFTDIMLFVLAIGVWCPCLLAVEACRAITFCCFCAR